MIAGDFPYIPMKSLLEVLSRNKYLLYPAYVEILKITANKIFRGVPFPWTAKQYPSPMEKRYEYETLLATVLSTQGATEGLLVGELYLCRIVKGEQSMRLSWPSIRRRDALSLQQAMTRGQVSECEGCFAEYPPKHLIHCDGKQPHVSHGPFASVAHV